MSAELAIEISNLRKRYGAKKALRGLTLDVPRGSICGLLGRNGAGKTTTLKLLLGLCRPTSGSGAIFGLPIDDPRASIGIRRQTGYVSEDKLFPPATSVGELLAVTRAFYASWSFDLEQRYLQTFGLRPKATAGSLSKGARSALALLLALPRGASLLLLDEPTEGLDPALREQALQALVALAAAQGTTILFSSHQLAEVEQIADRVAIIDEGRLVLNASLDELKSNSRRITFVFDTDAPAGLFPEAQLDGRTLSVLVNSNHDDVIARARSAGAVSVDVAPVSLKDIFLETSKGGRL